MRQAWRKSWSQTSILHDFFLNSVDILFVLCLIATSNSCQWQLKKAGAYMVIDDILELKSRCDFAQQIGSSYNLTEREVGCIFKIASHQDITSKDLSHLLGLSASRGSRIISRLAQRGFVKIVQDKEDRRSYCLSLSKEGEKCYADILEKKLQCEQRLTEHLTKQQQDIIKEGLNLLIQVM
jgi:DNA-binding MarR family transcriptional regulator